METKSCSAGFDSITGHLLVTGFNKYDPPGTQRLYIHVSKKLTGPYICEVYSYSTENPDRICEMEDTSPDYTIKEHGWFYNTDSFSAICEAHPIPSGPTQEVIFIDWRDSLLEFLNKNFDREKWVPIKQ